MEINNKNVGNENVKKAAYRLYEYIMQSDNIVFFGGAGVSTESGIPDFRSKDGLYNQHDIEFDAYEPEYLLSEECLHHKPKVFYEFYRQKMDARGIKPNITHYVLAKLEQMGKLKAVVTQNIDGLHQLAGSKNVIELHGATTRNYCERCHKIIYMKVKRLYQYVRNVVEWYDRMLRYMENSFLMVHMKMQLKP